MIPNRYSEPYSSLISAFISNEDVNESSDSSSLGWLWPENQLGFKDDQAKASRLEKKGEIMHYETMVRYCYDFK